MKIGIFNYRLSNIKSVCNAIEYFDHEYILINNHNDLNQIDKLILPGVGSFDALMNYIVESNFIEPLEVFVNEEKKDFLGICLGLQILFESSDEGNMPGLGWLKGRCLKFNNKQIAVPHVGWSEVEVMNNSNLFNGIKENNDFYFVHSYYVPISNINNATHGKSTYDVDFISFLEIENIYAVQFHPEKSQMSGLKIIENFIKN